VPLFFLKVLLFFQFLFSLYSRIENNFLKRNF
jgi:hypothetical protein